MNSVKMCISAILMISVSMLFAFDDEPDELNWDNLGGTLTGFNHFKSYCEANPSFAKKILAESALDKPSKKLESVWVKAEAFANAPINDWFGIQEAGGEKCIVGPAAHNCGMMRIGVEIPEDGLYRVWVRYYHVVGTIASFSLKLSDGRLADETDREIAYVHDEFAWRYDWAEWARRGGPIATYKDESEGFIWEASPLVKLEEGLKALTIQGLTCADPWSERRIAAIVITREPIAVPELKPEDDNGENIITFKTKCSLTGEALKLWQRRPQICEDNDELKPLWKQWRKAFFADLMAGKLETVEAKRMAKWVYFDEESNLIGSPIDVEAGKKQVEDFIANSDVNHFYKRVEAESFEIEKDWYVEDSTLTSGGAWLVSGYWGGEGEAHKLVSVPVTGKYNIWLRYFEAGGLWSKYYFRIKKPDDTLIAEAELGWGDTWNNQHNGMYWIHLAVDLDETDVLLSFYKNEGGQTYRRPDEIIITDNLEFKPEGAVELYKTLNKDRDLTVWRQNSTYIGFSRTAAPLDDENLEPYTLELKPGEIENIMLLVRNNTSSLKEVTPVIKGDKDHILSWKVNAFHQAWPNDWQSCTLLEREHMYVRPGETAGIWLRLDGRNKFRSRDLAVLVGDERFELKVEKGDAIDDDVPVPYVFGWSAPDMRVSCWELYRDLGVNVINDTAITKAEADKYGIKLMVRLNDGNVSAEHVEKLVGRYKALGYDYDDWAWSFMDEPPDNLVDQWVEMAQKLKGLDPNVKIWVNPGEVGCINVSNSCRLTEYANCYCPYVNHFHGAANDPVYGERLKRREGGFDIEMAYLTPCFGEKGPLGVFDYFGLWGLALDRELNGWGFFALQYGFTYCNSVWDEVNAYIADQSMNIYPGAAGRTITTRNAEAVRSGIQQYRHAYKEFMAKRAEESKQ